AHMELHSVQHALLRSVDARRARVRHYPRDLALAESLVDGRRHCAPVFYRRQIMTIEIAISGTVYTQLVTTTSILAKLVVCAILLASIANAQAANDDSNRSGISRRSGVHTAQKFSGATQRPFRKADHSNLAKLEREWERLH